MKYIDRHNVLILNKHWIPINTTTARHSFSLMYSDHAKRIMIEEDKVVPLEWHEWICLKVNDTDKKIKTVKGFIKIPTVIVLNYYDKIPRQNVKFTQKIYGKEIILRVNILVKN
jgi:hypothetical protein